MLVFILNRTALAEFWPGVHEWSFIRRIFLSVKISLIAAINAKDSHRNSRTPKQNDAKAIRFKNERVHLGWSCDSCGKFGRKSKTSRFLASHKGLPINQSINQSIDRPRRTLFDDLMSERYCSGIVAEQRAVNGTAAVLSKWIFFPKFFFF